MRKTCRKELQQIWLVSKCQYLQQSLGIYWALQMYQWYQEKTFHVCKKDFFLLFLKPVTVSHPLKAWKNNIPLLFAGPRWDEIICIGIHLLLFPNPKDTQSCSSPKSFSSQKNEIAIITTSVSLARMQAVFMRSFARACFKWTNILVLLVFDNKKDH